MNTHFPWQEINLVFLDMDGVLLDKYFDDYFWEEFIPAKWMEQNGGTYEEARATLLATYKKVENTLAWCDLNYWSEQLDLDIFKLKTEANNLINLRPGVLLFLKTMKAMGKPLFMVTNAHPRTLEVKMGKIDLRPWFEEIISANSVGFAKEQPQFWEALQEHIPYVPKTTFFADDNERVLNSAKNYGVGHLLHIARPSSHQHRRISLQFASTDHLSDIIDIARYQPT